MRQYPTNLTDNQWRLLDSILNDDRKRKYSLRHMLDAANTHDSKGASDVIAL